MIVDLNELYRPTLLHQVVGNPHVTETLRASFKRGEFWPVYLFAGPTGHGKTTLAHIVARHANCAKLTASGDVCGKCPSCTSTNHSDISEHDFGTDTGIDYVRDLLKTVNYAPLHKHRVFVLDEFHLASGAAQKAFLKPFEAAKKSVIWIICTTNPEKLPDAIRGRAQGRFDLEAVEVAQMRDHLIWVAKQEKLNLSSEHATRIAQSTQCQPRESLQVLLRVLAQTKSLDATTLAKQLPAILTANLKLTPVETSLRVLKGIYTGNMALVLKYGSLVENPAWFLKGLVDQHINVLKREINPQLADPQMEWFLKQIDYEILPTQKEDRVAIIMGAILNELHGAEARAAAYGCDPKHILLTSLVNCVCLTK